MKKNVIFDKCFINPIRLATFSNLANYTPYIKLLFPIFLFLIIS